MCTSASLCSLGWIVLLVTVEPFNTSLGIHHLHVLLSQISTVLEVVHALVLIALLQRVTGDFERVDADPLFSKHGLLSFTEVLVVVIVDIVE